MNTKPLENGREITDWAKYCTIKKTKHVVIKIQGMEEVGEVYLWKCTKCGHKTWTR